ncbi:hypothetical protein FB595_13812 [Sphingobium sp. AEW010]|nr:hypothetical protein [Sphingobium sp. JAI105]TWC97207.1 hypothetical protein FB595_13812 [Sphingobium sp. AEW010]TWD17387.1 hypothetical protein FB596_13912 [Sphingobium sp. AEW013]TWD19909.1 hypothetical protein FB594_13912 [Sphingobium sp. AEW001]
MCASAEKSGEINFAEKHMAVDGYRLIYDTADRSSRSVTKDITMIETADFCCRSSRSRC